jgi:glucose-6-phosphate isomerase
MSVYRPALDQTCSAQELHKDWPVAFCELPMFNMVALGAHDAHINGIVNNLKSQFKRFVVFGVGGSSLGGQLIQACTENPDVDLTFVENIDPLAMKKLFDSVDLGSTGFVIISKSGHTPETIAQLLSLEAVCQQRDCLDVMKNIVVLTTATESPLTRIAHRLGCHMIPHDPDVGGRYSVFSTTGAIIGSLVGLDMTQFRQGATLMLQDASLADGARHFCAHAHAHISHHVCMTYGDHLQTIAMWYRQLWGESLGKDGKGAIISVSRGIVDQHSQLQFYLDGPQHTYYTFFNQADTVPGLPVMHTDDPELSYIEGRTVQDLFNAEGRATCDVLVNNGAPVRTFSLERSALSWGKVCAQLMVEVILIAHHMQINPFDQPAVEGGKRRTREILKAS